MEDQTRANLLKWLATVLISISALMVSLSVELSAAWYSYVGFMTGQTIWATYAVKMKEWPLFALNFSFIFINIYAIYIRV